MKPVLPNWRNLEPPVGLHRMNAEELRNALDALGISQTWLAAWLGTDRHQMSRWCREKSGHPVPWWMTFVIYLLQTERAELGYLGKLEADALETALPMPDRLKPPYSWQETPQPAPARSNGKAEHASADGP